MHVIRYLALGDSYTIGESVESGERWPNQLASLMEASPNLPAVAWRFPSSRAQAGPRKSSGTGFKVKRLNHLMTWFRY